MPLDTLSSCLREVKRSLGHDSPQDFWESWFSVPGALFELEPSLDSGFIT